MSGITGGCFCGKTRYTTTSPLYGLQYCYCRTCQLVHGAPFAPFTNVHRDSFQWVENKHVKELKLSSFATRTVCGECHAPITMVYHARPEEVGIVAVTVDEEFMDTVPEVQGHIYVKGKPGWYTIVDDVKQDWGAPNSLKPLIPGKYLPAL
ncbi:Mss4-like protein [Aspergillus filifer]